MTNDERLIARILFVNRVLKANNNAFQQLFWAVMRAKHNQDFVEVRPQGRAGDGGNDGYLPADGHYFQLYAPIDVNAKLAIAAEKLVKDFENLKKSWQATTPIRAYSFVFNDKYEGTFTKIVQALGSIERTNENVKCRPFTAGHLENEFMELSDDRMRGVLGTVIPDPIKIAAVDYTALREVITHIMNSPANAVTTRFGDLPELGEKIRLNNLCSAWGDLIRKGSRQSGHVDNYFAKNSTFMKQSLRDHLVETYRHVRDIGRAVASIPDGLTRDDLIFDDFRQALLPDNATRAAEDAVEILVGYYFEACDVFDPHSEKASPNASA